MASAITPTSVTKDAASAMETLLKTSKYSDLTIRCQDYVFKVHRSVICTRSKPLAAAVDGQFKESITGEIDLSEDEPIIVDKFVEFLYASDFDATITEIKHASISKQKATSTVSPSREKPTRSSSRSADSMQLEDTPNANHVSDSQSSSPTIEEEKSAPITDPPEDSATGPLVTLAKVYIIADLWDVPALKDLTKAKYETMVVKNWNDPAFAESVRLIYDNTGGEDREMKDVTIATARKNIKNLLDRGEFRNLLKDIGEVGLDILSPFVVSKLDASVRRR